MTKSYNNALDYVIPSAANGGLTVEGVSRYVYIFSCSENLNIDCYDEDGDRVAHIQNFPSGLGQPVTGGFVKMVVTTESGNAGTAKLGTGTDMGVFTMLTGIVSILDTTSDEYETNIGMIYSGSFNQAAGGANYTFAKLRNPVGSGKKLILKRIKAASTAGANAFQYYGSVDVTDYAAADPLQCRYLGGGFGASVAKLTTGANGNGGDAAMFFVERDLLAAQNQYVDDENNRLIIAPGSALLLSSGNQNIDLRGSFAWVEKAYP